MISKTFYKAAALVSCMFSLNAFAAFNFTSASQSKRSIQAGETVQLKIGVKSTTAVSGVSVVIYIIKGAGLQDETYVMSGLSFKAGEGKSLSMNYTAKSYDPAQRIFWAARVFYNGVEQALAYECRCTGFVMHFDQTTGATVSAMKVSLPFFVGISILPRQPEIGPRQT